MRITIYLMIYIILLTILYKLYNVIYYYNNCEANIWEANISRFFSRHLRHFV